MILHCYMIGLLSIYLQLYVRIELKKRPASSFMCLCVSVSSQAIAFCTITDVVFNAHALFSGCYLYSVPSRKQFSEVIIPNMYLLVAQEVKEKLSRAEQVALTTDGWTSRATESYITITSSHIYNDWKVKNFVLQTRSMGESHTAENICATLQASVEEWKLPTKCGQPPVVSDNAANMVKAKDLFQSTLFVPCFAHTLSLPVQKALKIKRVSHVLAKVRRIVAIFHRSTFAANLLQSKAQLLNITHRKLKIYVVTQWNSAYKK